MTRGCQLCCASPVGVLPPGMLLDSPLPSVHPGVNSASLRSAAKHVRESTNFTMTVVQTLTVTVTSHAGGIAVCIFIFRTDDTGYVEIYMLRYTSAKSLGHIVHYCHTECALCKGVMQGTKLLEVCVNMASLECVSHHHNTFPAIAVIRIQA